MFQNIAPAPSNSASACDSSSCSPAPAPASANQNPPAASTGRPQNDMGAWGPYLEFDITPGQSTSPATMDTPAYYANLATPSATTTTASTSCATGSKPIAAAEPKPGPSDTKRPLRDIEDLLPAPKKPRATDADGGASVSSPGSSTSEVVPGSPEEDKPPTVGAY